MMDFKKEAEIAVAEGTANETVQNIVEQEKLAESQGFVKYDNGGRTFFSYGRKLEVSGQNNFLSKVQKHEDMPFATDVLSTVDDIIKKEERTIVHKSMPSIKMTYPNQLVKISENNYLPVSTWAMKQLMERAGAPSGAINVLRPSEKFIKLPDHVVSSVFNSYMDKASGSRGPKETNLRIRTWNDTKEIFAAVSDRYNILDFPDVVRHMLDSLSIHNGKGEFQYDGFRWRFTVRFMKTQEPTVGDFFETQLSIVGADDGSHPIQVKVEVIRVRCLNLTTLTSEQVESVRHNVSDLVGRLKTKVAEMFKKIDAFPKLWNEAATRDVCEKAAELGIDKIFDILVHKKLVHVPGVSDEEMVSRLMQAWHLEPGYHVSDISNAISRAANSNPWENPWTVNNLADQAGQVLYVNRLVTKQDIADAEDRWANLEV